jgi:hypothetical protein
MAANCLIWLGNGLEIRNPQSDLGGARLAAGDSGLVDHAESPESRP